MYIKRYFCIFKSWINVVCLTLVNVKQVVNRIKVMSVSDVEEVKQKVYKYLLVTKEII